MRLGSRVGKHKPAHKTRRRRVLDGGYLKRLEADLTRWRASGQLTAAQAEALLADAQTRADKPSVGFANVAALLGAILFGLGAITFVAANWAALPKIARMGAAFALIWVTFLLAVFADKRGNPMMTQALALIGALAMGGAIAMVGQTYHIEGTPADLMIPWCVGAALTALVFNSRPVTILYVILGLLYFVFLRPEGFFDRTPVAHVSLDAFAVPYIPVWFVGVLLARHYDSGAAMHLSGLGALCWVVALFADAIWLGHSHDWMAAGAMIFAFGAASTAFCEYLRVRAGGSRAGAVAVAWSAACAFVGLGIAQFSLSDGKPLSVQMLFSAAVIALSVWAIHWGDAPGRKAVRGFAVALFVFECFYIYVTLFQGLLDTSLFLLGGGALLLALGFGLRQLTSKPKEATP
jgi:uncharacterized membrane protein